MNTRQPSAPRRLPADQGWTTWHHVGDQLPIKKDARIEETRTLPNGLWAVRFSEKTEKIT